MAYQDGQGCNLKRDVEPHDLPEEYRRDCPTLDYAAIIRMYWEAKVAQETVEENK
jgi:hypothetical protein